MPYPKIKQTTDHPFHDPHTDKHLMPSRIAKDEDGNWHVWLWSGGSPGWVLGGADSVKGVENVQDLLDLPYGGPSL
jgi:hypothetical protein